MYLEAFVGVQRKFGVGLVLLGLILLGLSWFDPESFAFLMNGNFFNDILRQCKNKQYVQNF